MAQKHSNPATQAIGLNMERLLIPSRLKVFSPVGIP
jgi:hypothetical protein